MEDPALAFILDEALALLDDGEEIEAVIERFPEFAGKLLPLLNVASRLAETADDAIEVPLKALKEIGEFLQDKFEELTDQG